MLDARNVYKGGVVFGTVSLKKGDVAFVTFNLTKKVWSCLSISVKKGVVFVTVNLKRRCGLFLSISVK